MMGGDWVWYLGAGVLGAGALWLFVWAWWGDRSRGRARCGRCWYLMDGLVGLAGAAECPECGWRVRRVKQLYRTRRRRGWMVAAVVLGVSAVAAWYTPWVRENGWWSVAPEWVLLRVARSEGTPTGALATEFERRYKGDEWARLAPRVYAWNRPMRLLRDSWVKGVPVRGRWQSTFISGPAGGLSIYLDPARLEAVAMNDADPSSNQSHENWWTPLVNVAVPAEVSGDQARFMVSIESAHHCGVVPSPPPFFVDVSLKSSLDEVMAPVTTGGMEVFGLLSPSVFVLPTTRNIALSVGDVQAARLGAEVALGLKMEIVRFGETIAKARWYQGTASRTMTGRPVLVRCGAYEAGSKDNSPMTLSLQQLIADGCVVRFSTDEEMALSALGYEKYWKGSFEVPLRDLVK